MNFDNFEEIHPYIKAGNLKDAIQYCKTEIGKLNASIYHQALDRDFLAQTEPLLNWIDAFYASMCSKSVVVCMYFEINEFDINRDRWYCDGFAYEVDNGLDDIDWLASWSGSTDNDFTLTGFEDIQESVWTEFDPENYDPKEFERLQAEEEKNAPAWDWFELLVLLRFLELVEAAHKEAHLRDLSWGKLPIYATEHEFDILYRTQS
ncbi:hypothetical protein [Spirosoma foliorum]|uniref:DUF4303 domain-containing protein n=1 Tax=Spirosoma foliorum TaxID=2710596 RepID=A0A7G5GNP2_9BACT|nr:hypothetical protein [Spirosoma foliorum]QMW00484.1 hypothetical protein H3H32_21035 [Spirosoma foliorum]